MSVIGLLEGQRLRYRLGDPFVTPEAWDAADPNGWRKNDRAKNTTDWSRLWLDNQASARETYMQVNSSSIDPEQYPTLDAWLLAHGGIPGNPSTGTPINTTPASATPGMTNAEYADWAAKQAAEAARLAKLPRDPVIGPAFLPDPPAMQECTGRSGEVTCTSPASDSRGGRADENLPEPLATASEGKSLVLPLLALAAAWMVLK